MTTSEVVNNMSRQAEPRPIVKAMSQLRQLISAGEWDRGQKLPTEFELAVRLGVSRGTARNALTRLEDLGIIRALDASGGKIRGRVVVGSGPCRSLMSRTIMLMTHHPSQVQGPAAVPEWNKEMFIEAGISDATQSASLNFLCLRPSSLTDADIGHLLDDPPIGLLANEYVAREVDSMAVIARLVRGGLSLVATGGPAFAAYDRVISDHESGAYELTRWLIARGRRRIVQLGFSDPELYWVKQRAAGYRRAMAEAGLETIERVYVPIRVGDRRSVESVTEDEFRTYVRQAVGFVLDATSGATAAEAIMADNDVDAAYYLAALRMLGRKPNDDVAVVGYDNAWMNPQRAWEPARPAATVDKLNMEIGRRMVRTLLDRTSGRLSSEEAPRVCIVPPKLIDLSQN